MYRTYVVFKKNCYCCRKEFKGWTYARDFHVSGVCDSSTYHEYICSSCGPDLESATIAMEKNLKRIISENRNRIQECYLEEEMRKEIIKDAVRLKMSIVNGNDQNIETYNNLVKNWPEIIPPLI